MELKFEWDQTKDQENQKKHGVSFEEAKTVFNDPFSITITDLEHSINEDRFINIGISQLQRILVVVYTERQEKIRIISCRKANLQERKNYEQH